MEVLKVFILKSLNEKYSNTQFSYTQIRDYVHKAYRIPKNITDDVLTRLINEGYIIKNSPCVYKLNSNVMDYVTTFLEKSHLERNRTFLK